MYTTYKDTNARMNIKTCRFENVKSFLTIYLKIKSGKRKKRHVMKCDNMVFSKLLVLKHIPYDSELSCSKQILPLIWKLNRNFK